MQRRSSIGPSHRLWKGAVNWVFQAKLCYFGGGAAEFFMLA